MGRIQNMDPWSMDHPCGSNPWTPSWAYSMDYPCGPPLIFEDKFNQRSKRILGTFNGRYFGQRVLSGGFLIFYTCSNFSKFHTNVMGSF